VLHHTELFLSEFNSLFFSQMRFLFRVSLISRFFFQRKTPHLMVLTVTILFMTLSCENSDEKDSSSEVENNQGSEETIKKLKMDLDLLEWEVSRLALKIPSVNGNSLVLDKKTGLWHYDVDREPFTGRSIELYPDETPLVEAFFLNGKRDGIQRLWYADGSIKSDGQWYDGKKNGVFREWNDKGTLIRVERFKEGKVIEVLRN
jgi:antitoxin component YwqK of YwqJK toxin-antitoxin module